MLLDDNPSMLDIQDFRNFPGMLDCLQEEHKKKLVQYLESKVSNRYKKNHIIFL